MKSLKIIFWFRSSCVYTKTTCGILENDADQWQICQKMALVLTKRNLDLGGGGGGCCQTFSFILVLCSLFSKPRENSRGTVKGPRSLSVLFTGFFLEVWTSYEKLGNCFLV